LEVYLLNLLLAYRPILQIGGVVLLVYAVVSIAISPKVSIVVLVLAIFLLLITFSYQATLYLAKIGAWIGTLRKNND
jgi:hypothetical protein